MKGSKGNMLVILAPKEGKQKKLKFNNLR